MDKGAVFLLVIVAIAYFIYLPILILAWRKDFRDKAAKKAEEDAKAERQRSQIQQKFRESEEEIADLHRQVHLLQDQLAGQSEALPEDPEENSAEERKR